MPPTLTDRRVSQELTQLRADGSPESLELARQLEAELEDHKLEHAEGSERELLQRAADTREAAEGVDLSEVNPTGGEGRQAGTELTVEDVRRAAEAQGAGSDDDGDELESIDFASDSARELAQENGLGADDFDGEDPSGASGFTVADVRELI